MDAPCIFPTLRYQDADAAIDWLRNVAGFREHAVFRDNNGIVMHAEMALGASMLMLGTAKNDEYGRLVGDPSAKRTDAIYIAVDDIIPIHARAVSAGSEIAQAPYDTPYGSREFSCRDTEGNLFSFGTYWPKAAD